MLFINFIRNHHLEISFLFYEKSELIIFLLMCFMSVLLANLPINKILAFSLCIGSFLLPFIYIIYFQMIVLEKYFEQEVQKNNFHYGCMTYYATTRHQPKGSRDFSYNDYYIINNKFTEVHIRWKNSPIGKQINDFKNFLNSDICYPVRYVEFKFLFYKKIKVYDLVEKPN